jgi:hypothetical protein
MSVSPLSKTSDNLKLQKIMFYYRNNEKRSAE